MRGLYLHIPFCAQKCHYCDFVITTDGSVPMRQRFLSALEKEARRAAESYSKLSFDSLYLGGGTPSLLDGPELRRVLEILRGGFRITPEAEVTCEINPGDAELEKLLLYRELGINRISVGAQSFNDRLLKEMGRLHDAAAVRKTLLLLQQSGFTNISLDLILRLPNQTIEEALASIKEGTASGVSQLVLYDLDIHEKTRFGSLQRQGRLPLPGEEFHRRMFEEAQRLLEESGYRHYELMTFAKPGFESRHNLVYWRNGEYLGLGPGAYSYLEGTRWLFAGSVPRWLHKCERNDWTPEESEKISEKNSQVESLLTGLRLEEGVAWERIPALQNLLNETMIPLVEEGLLVTDERLRLTRKGRFIAESVISRLATVCLD